MSAAVSNQNESKQPDLTGVGQDNKTGRVGWIKGLRKMLSLVAAQFAQPPGIAGSTEQFGWARKGTVVVGLVAALLGLPGGLITAIKSFETLKPSYNKPSYNMEVSVGQLAISYRPEHEQVSLVLAFKAKENGPVDNEILPGKAWVKAPSLISPPDLALNADISFVEGDFRTTKAVIANGAEPREMQCRIVFRFDDRTREVFQTAGLRRLVVELRGKDQNYPLSFSFELNDSSIARLLRSEEIRYLTTDQLIED